MSKEFFIRTEDIPANDILGYYASSSRDKGILDDLKSRTPVVLVGSRGTGKSFLLRVAEAQLKQEKPSGVLPVYVSFQRSGLVHSDDPKQFYHWMLGRICSRLARELRTRGFLSGGRVVQTLTGLSSIGVDQKKTPIEEVVDQYESSSSHVNYAALPDVESLRDAIEDLCESTTLGRVCLLFDEAAHVFRPRQQREFFSLFRDLRSPYISCKAAIYPGITSFGDVFDPSHDAKFIEISRFVEDEDYLSVMREMVRKQIDESAIRSMDQNSENFNALAYAASGNPRLLLKTIQQVGGRFGTREVKALLKEFFRAEVWREHSALAEKFAGHRDLIDWSRNFVDQFVIPDARLKNAKWQVEGKNESTCFFWVHRDAPKVVHHSIRLLSYTGIVIKRDDGVIATRRGVGTRFSVSLGCLASPEAEPIAFITRVARHLAIKRFTEFGANEKEFRALSDKVGDFTEIDTSPALESQLLQSTDRLDLTPLQVRALKDLRINTIGDALRTSEEDFKKVKGIKDVRSRQLRNAIIASVLEYLSG